MSALSRKAPWCVQCIEILCRTWASMTKAPSQPSRARVRATSSRPTMRDLHSGKSPFPLKSDSCLCDVRKKFLVSSLHWIALAADPNSDGFVSIIVLFVKWVEVEVELVGRPRDQELIPLLVHDSNSGAAGLVEKSPSSGIWWHPRCGEDVIIDAIEEHSTGEDT